MTRNDFNTTYKTIKDILSPFGPNQVKEANREMKKVFGKRLSQVKSSGACEYSYYILCYEDEWELNSFNWDFFSHSFA